MIPSMAVSIFLLATVLGGGAWWWLGRKAGHWPVVLRESYKLGLIIVYGLQLALLLMFSV